MMCMDGVTEAKIIRDTIENIIKTYEFNYEEVGNLDFMQQDLLHKIEARPLDVLSGYKIYKQFREVRLNRRKMKLENEMIKPLYDICKKNETIINEISCAIGQSRKVNEDILRKKYRARVMVNDEESINKGLASNLKNVYGIA